MAKVLIVGFFTEWVTHLGTELEIAQRHLDVGDEVHFLICDGVIGGCRDNPTGDAERCGRCLYRRNRSIQLLTRGVMSHYLSSFIETGGVEGLDSAASVVDKQSAIDWRFQGESLGWGALSSAVDVFRDPEGIDERFRLVLPRLSKAAALSYLGTLRFLEHSSRFDQVYVFNGRFECTLGAAKACLRYGLRPSLHERGANVRRFAVFRDDILHSRKAQRSRIMSAWNAAANPAGAESVAMEFYQDRRKGCDKSWWSFTHRQQYGRLPQGWDATKKNIVIFNSSEDEMAAVGDEWKSDLYARQSIGIERIVADLNSVAPETRVYLRLHPNLSGVDNADMRRLRKIQSPNLFLIEPDSSISSYELLDHATTVLTFGSTVGIEAAYWGKPSVLAGPALYETLGSVYLPRTHQEVIELLTKELLPLDRLGALQYAFYWQSLGEEFRYWVAEGFIDGKFRGHSLHFRGVALLRIFNLLARHLSLQSGVMRAVSRLLDTVSQLKSKTSGREAGKG